MTGRARPRYHGPPDGSPSLLAFGYNTNGFAHHDLEACFDVLADLGYEGVALSLDTHHLSPFRSSATDVARVAAELERRRLRVSIETGARYILDPRRKHEPTLLSDDGRERRLDFLFIDPPVYRAATPPGPGSANTSPISARGSSTSSPRGGRTASGCSIRRTKMTASA